MAYDQLMQTYLGVGLLADRPAAPNVKAGVGAFYYGTDTAALYVWDGSMWHTLAGGPTTLAGDSDVAIAAPADGQVLTYVSADATWENKAAAGGASGALTKLGEVIVGAGGQATIAFSSIDQRFRHLRLCFQLRGDNASTLVDLRAQFNGDTTANYDWAFSYSNSNGAAPGTAAATAATYAKLCDISAGSAPTAATGSGAFDLLNYAATSFRKYITGSNEVISADSATNYFHQSGGAGWRSTAAMTSILLFPSSGNFAPGSVASLYGIS